MRRARALSLLSAGELLPAGCAHSSPPCSWLVVRAAALRARCWGGRRRAEEEWYCRYWYRYH